MLSEEHKVSTAPASDAIADAIRTIVREELERASIEPPLSGKALTTTSGPAVTARVRW